LLQNRIQLTWKDALAPTNCWKRHFVLASNWPQKIAICSFITICCQQLYGTQGRQCWTGWKRHIEKRVKQRPSPSHTSDKCLPKLRRIVRT